MAQTREQQILHNVQVHDAIADRYEHVHREIFNTHEQARMAAAVARVVGYVRHQRTAPRALDVGCGSGNVTARLLAEGCVVTAADVAKNFLALCDTKFGATGRLQTLLLRGDGLQELPAGAFDVVSAYSVLHHVPDYLHLVAEMARVLAPGGVLYIDHEASERIYTADPVYREFAALAGKRRSGLKRFLTRTHRRRAVVHSLRAVLRPGFQTEGDIHVWPDDHIEFARIRKVVEANGCEVLEDQEYLLHPDGVAPAVYEAFARRCADMRLLVARKTA